MLLGQPESRFTTVPEFCCVSIYSKADVMKFLDGTFYSPAKNLVLADNAIPSTY
jgi:hypothetical protein